MPLSSLFLVIFKNEARTIGAEPAPTTCARVQPLDLRAKKQAKNLPEGPSPGPSRKVFCFLSTDSDWEFSLIIVFFVRIRRLALCNLALRKGPSS